MRAAEVPHLKISFVVPRYGTEVVGGAESAARAFAENLVKLGVETKVLTTTAIDIDTWAHHYREGQTTLNGVEVYRFRPDSGRSAAFPEFSNKVLFLPRSTSLDDCKKWIELQGPVSEALLEAIATDRSDFLVFYPYLYHPIVYGLPRVKDRAILHPAAHPEPPIYLPIFKEVFESARAIILQSQAERDVVNKTFKVGATRQLELGLGVAGPPNDIKQRLSKYKSEDPPYILCLGRVDDHKGTTMLSDFFTQYKERNPSNLKLVMAGPIVVKPPSHEDVEILGVVSDEQKWELIAGAQSLISPSYFEAFSIVLFEAWALNTPVIVNQRCGPTFEHVSRSGGGLAFYDYPTFEVVLNRISNDLELRKRLGELGNKYYLANFTWERVIKRYFNFLIDLKSHGFDFVQQEPSPLA